MSNEIRYEGRDLEAMSFAENYHAWIKELFQPFLGKRIVEVGAGTGDFSALLASTKPELLLLVEPSERQWKILDNRFSGQSNGTVVKTINSIFSAKSDWIGEQRPDSIIYVNVMEHIENDRDELRAVYNALSPGGRVFIFVPAHQWLYGAYDKSIGHYRRYSMQELKDKCTDAGFSIVHRQFFDLAGIIPWYVKYRLLGSTSMEPGMIRIFDRFVVPIQRLLEPLLRSRMGKNILLIGERKDADQTRAPQV